MIISHIKSANDATSKRKLQKELLDLEVANEEELERRVRDFKNPNKPIPVAPQYKTNAQLAKDLIEQERQAIKNMEELGFDYNRGTELTTWLSSSEVNRLVEFNANFKGIKKELTETTNPKLLTVDYIKNYLERYFEDLDVSYGRKFSSQTSQSAGVTDLSIDELQAAIPDNSTIENIKSEIPSLLEIIKQKISLVYQQLTARESGTARKSLQSSGESKDESETETKPRLPKRSVPQSKSSMYNEFETLSENNITIEKAIDKLNTSINKKTRSLRKTGPGAIISESIRANTERDINELGEKRAHLITRKEENDGRLSIIQQELTAMKSERESGLYRSRTDVMDRWGINDELDKQIASVERELNELRKLYNDGQIAYQLLILLSIIVPSDEFLNTFKLSLPLLQRTELVRRYTKLLTRLKAPTEASLIEILGETTSAGDNIERMKMLFKKIQKMLSFITLQKNADAIASLNRNYEIELSKTDKTGEYQKIKQINDANENKEKIARESLAEVMRDVADVSSARFDNDFYNIAGNRTRYTKSQVEAEADLELERNRLTREEVEALAVDDIIKKSDYEKDPISRKNSLRQMRFNRENNVRLIEDEDEDNGLDEVLQERMRKVFADTLESLPREQRLSQALQLAENKQEIKKKIIKDINKEETGKKLSEMLGARNRTISERREAELRLIEVQAHKSQMLAYYNSILDAIEGLSNATARYNTMRQLAEDLALPTGNIRQSRAGTEDKNQAVREYRELIGEWVLAKIEINANDLLYDPRSMTRDDYKPVIQYSGSSYGNKENVGVLGGFGIARDLHTHFKEDENELRDIKRDLKRHKKTEMNIAGVGFQHTRIKIGRGVNIDDKQPTYKTFGKYVIHMKHLNDRNIANFKYPSLGSIPSIKARPITDEYKEFIIETIESGQPNERQFRRLTQDEREHFEKVCVGAGLLEQFRLKKTGDDEDKKRVDRFNILRGELLAGNNNENLIKELRGLVVRFMNDGKIARQEGTNMLMELSVI